MDETQELAFESYGYIDPMLPPPMPEDDDNYAANQVLCESYDTADLSYSDDVTILSEDDYATDNMETSPFLVRCIGIDMNEDELLAGAVADNPPHATALHALDFKIAQMATTRHEFYKKMRVDERQLNHRAHLDGGSMATTTDRLDLIWHCRPITTNVSLNVADKTPHHPTAEGFLRIPTDTPLGYTMVKTFYTPTLPATIVSPAATSTAHGCSGYTSISKHSGLDCCVTLVDCRRRSQNISFPAQLVRGLLYQKTIFYKEAFKHISKYNR